jgi:hypothetical protein
MLVVTQFATNHKSISKKKGFETHKDQNSTKLILVKPSSQMRNKMTKILCGISCCQISSFIYLLVFRKLKDRPELIRDQYRLYQAQEDQRNESSQLYTQQDRFTHYIAGPYCFGLVALDLRPSVLHKS